jgi:hypothetical protein
VIVPRRVGRFVRLALDRLKGRDMVKLQGPKETNSISLGGQTFEVIDGIIEVPAELAHFLTAHGFFPYKEPARPAAPATPPPVMPSSTRKRVP